MRGPFGDMSVQGFMQISEMMMGSCFLTSLLGVSCNTTCIHGFYPFVIHLLMTTIRYDT